MSCVKVFPPSKTIINIFYYYSYFALFISLLITPLTIFVIFKQSKNLKNFKWLILNHTFWCILFEMHIASIKPIFLPPTLSGYPVGILKNGSFKLSAILCLFIFRICANSVTSLLATLLCRYLLVFPATKWFSQKRGIYLMVIYSIITAIIFIFIFYPFLFIDPKDFYTMALEYDPCLKEYFLKEPGFVFLSNEIAKQFLYLLFIVVVSGTILMIFLALYFIYLVKTNTSATTTKLSTSLMISAIVQLSLTIVIYLIPMTIFAAIYAFEIYHFENVMIFLISCISTHSFLESFATLYFVTPYRKYVIQLFYEIWPLKTQVVPVKIHIFKK